MVFNGLKRNLVSALLVGSLLLGCAKDNNNPTSPHITTPKPPAPTTQIKTPVITSSPIIQVNENSYYQYYPQATDPQNLPLTWYLDQNPSWISMSSGNVHGNSPYVFQDQTSSVRLRVSNGTKDTTQAYNLTVKCLYHVVVPTANQVTNVGPNSITFSQPVNFLVGDVLVSGVIPAASNGFLKEVTSISSDRKTAQTKNSTLEKALKGTSFSIHQTLTPANAKPYGNIVKGISPASRAGYNFSYDLKDAPLAEQFGFNVVANGNLSFNIDHYLNFDPANKKFLFQLIFDETADLKVTSNLSLYLQATEKTIKRLDLGTYTFMAGPIPVVLTPKLDIVVGITSSKVSDLEAKVTQKASMNPGIIYGNGWSYTGGFSNSFDFSVPTVGSDIDTKVYGQPTLTIFLYDGLTPGPQAGISAGLRFNASSIQNWKLYGDLAVGLGVDMGIWSILIPNYYKTVIDYEKPLAESQTIQPPPITSGRIVFSSLRNNITHVYSINPDGSQEINLTNTPSTWDVSPSWSQNATQIVYSSAPNGSNLYYDVWVMNSDGSSKRKLAATSSILENVPVFSPDGTKIAYISKSSVSGYPQISIMNANGSNQSQIISGFYYLGDLCWFPSQRIAFASNKDNTAAGDQIYTMTSNSSDIKRLTNNSYYDRFPSWSPDGTKMAFATSRDGNWEVYVMNADGSNQVDISKSPSTDDVCPSWSPDGSKIVYVSSPINSQSTRLWIMDYPSGLNKKQITSDYSGWPRWSPK